MMKLIVAGYNIDSSLISSLDHEKATPEVISAAYARISRSNLDVDELRAAALKEVQKARKSNENIIYEMGHASIAEHAVFNLDLMDVSRLLTETIQRSRLASFTEKSQRYVTFGNDFVVPEELNKKPALKKAYKLLMKKLFAEYQDTFQQLVEHHQTQYPEAKLKDIENMAKEDARYILPLATRTQMGITINARSLEALIRRLAHSPLSEAKELKELLHSQISAICPSLIRHTEPDGFSGKVNLEAVGFSGFLQQEMAWLAELDMQTKVKLISAPKNVDEKILSAIIYTLGELNWTDNEETVTRLPKMAREQLWQQIFKGIRSWHKLPRAFEVAEFEFEIIMSESCWAQFKRHRQCTILKKDGGTGFDVIPPAVLEIKKRGPWQSLMTDAIDLSDSLPASMKHLRGYLRLNASPCRIYAKMNLREIYHFVRLRSDEHAQWEIRQISDAIVKIVKKHAPNASRQLCGKSDFKQIY